MESTVHILLFMFAAGVEHFIGGCRHIDMSALPQVSEVKDAID